MRLRSGRSLTSRRRETVETEVAVTTGEELETAVVDYVKACEEDGANMQRLSEAFKDYFRLLLVRESPLPGGSRMVGVCGHTVVLDDARLKATVRNKAAVVVR